MKYIEKFSTVLVLQTSSTYLKSVSHLEIYKIHYFQLINFRLSSGESQHMHTHTCI